jgi:glycosyltransferase involved in cell wall biosynthesis
MAVNQTLVDWAIRRLQVPAERVWYVPNFVCPPLRVSEPPALPGVPGGRIACVANLRPQKDHLTLVRAMAIVARRVPDAHLILIGSLADAAHARVVQSEISRLALGRHVSVLGQRNDVAELLQGCDIGVLSSASEGLPLALIEYGMAGLVPIATRVGQCAEVLDHGRAGVLVPPRSPEALAAALTELLTSAERRCRLRDQFRARVRDLYSPDAALPEICRIYELVGKDRVARPA